jgi:hypothetical protein
MYAHVFAAGHCAARSLCKHQATTAAVSGIEALLRGAANAYKKPSTSSNSKGSERISSKQESNIISNMMLVSNDRSVMAVSIGITVMYTAIKPRFYRPISAQSLFSVIVRVLT